MPSELKPCPRCQAPWHWIYHQVKGHCVTCDDCGYRGPYSRSKEQAIAAWNSRPEPATQKGVWSKNVSLASSAYPPVTQADDVALVPRDVAESWRAKAENYQSEIQSALSDISDMMNTIVDNWPVPRKLSTAVALVNKTLASMVSFDELARREAAAHAAGEAKGRADERADVVALIGRNLMSPQRYLDATERGDHEGTKGNA